jgi:hypothetical protein
MHFETPAPGIVFDIPDNWWAFADVAGFTARSDFYPPDTSPFEKVALADIRPPACSTGVPLIQKYKLVPVPFAFQSPECSLPLVKLIELPEPGR